MTLLATQVTYYYMNYQKHSLKSEKQNKVNLSQYFFHIIMVIVANTKKQVTTARGISPRMEETKMSFLLNIIINPKSLGINRKSVI